MITDQLSEMMIRSGRVGSMELETALAIQEESGRVLTDILIEDNLASPNDIARTFSEILNIPYLELAEDFHLKPVEYDMIPKSVARRFCLIPLVKEEGEAITVVMKNPLDMDAVDTVRSLTSFEIYKAVSTEAKINTIIDKCYREEAYLESRMPDRIAGTSDIYFEPGENSCAGRRRVDGSLHPVSPSPRSLLPSLLTRIKNLAEMDRAECRLPQDGRIKFKFSGHPLHGSLFRQNETIE